MPPPGGKTPYAQWADPENIYPVHFNPLLVYDLEIEDFKAVEGNLSRDFGSFGEVKSIFLPKNNIVDGKMFAKIHYNENDNAQKAMEGLSHKYKIADGKSAHKVLRKYRESLSRLDKSPSVIQPACATSFHDGHTCRAPENSHEMIYKP